MAKSNSQALRKDGIEINPRNAHEYEASVPPDMREGLNLSPITADVPLASSTHTLPGGLFVNESGQVVDAWGAVRG